MTHELDDAAVEAVYDALAAALDSVPATAETAFLCRLSLLLANACGERDVVLEAIRAAASGLAAPAR